MLEQIRATAPVSRVDLARATGLTPATMTTVVRQLIADGLVIEVGHARSTGGKPAMLLEIDPAARCAVGVKLGAESIIVVLANLWGAVVGRARIAGAGDRPVDDVVDDIARGVRELVVATGVPPEVIVGVGVAVSGALDVDGGTLLHSAELPGWAGYPLRRELEDRTGSRVLLDTVAVSAAVGEHWGGASGDARSLALVSIDADITVGLVIDGRAVRGATGNAGALGHVAVSADGPSCECGRRGCLQVTAAPRATLARYRERTGRSATHAQLTAAAVLGDPIAAGVLRESADALAVAVTSLAELVDLDEVVLAGSALGSAVSEYIPVLRHALDAHFVPRVHHPVLVRASVSLRDASASGAAALVLGGQGADPAPR